MDSDEGDLNLSANAFPQMNGRRSSFSRYLQKSLRCCLRALLITSSLLHNIECGPYILRQLHIVLKHPDAVACPIVVKDAMNDVSKEVAPVLLTLHLGAANP